MSNEKDQIEVPFAKLYELIYFPIGLGFFLIFKFKIRPAIPEENVDRIEFLFIACLVGLLFIAMSNVATYLSDLRRGALTFLPKMTPTYYKIIGIICIFLGILVWMQA